MISSPTKLVFSITQLLRYARILIWAMICSRVELAARLLAAESQLTECNRRIKQKQAPKPRFTNSFRLLWVVLSKLWAPWRKAVHLMQPATVVKWHRSSFRMYWRWKSRPRCGRPSIPEEMQTLIRRLSTENPLWGAGRIHDTLILLGFDAPCEDTIRKYMIKLGRLQDGATSWLAFLHNHVDVSWAMDFFNVATADFRFLYVFVIMHHERRRVIHFATTFNPSMEWVIQQLREATPFGRQPKYMFRDNDGIYGHGVRAFLGSCDIEEVRTAYRNPWQNPYVERFIGKLRRELLEHVIVLSENHLRRLLKKYIEDYYHIARPHQGLNSDTPISSNRLQPQEHLTKLVSIPICGGLHHRYERVAA